METVKPRVRILCAGKQLEAKEMGGQKDKKLPKHSANVESIIFIHEGECILHIGGEDKKLNPGDAHMIPPHVKHQFRGITDFKGVHFMPRDIEFEFFDD